MLLPAPLGPRTSVALAGEQRREAGARLGADRAFSATLEHVDAHRDVRREALARRGERRQVALVEDDARRDLGARGGDQRARQLRLAEHRLGGDHDQQLVEVGGERLGLPLVLAKEQVAARQDRLDDAFVARRPASGRDRRRRQSLFLPRVMAE